MAVLSRDGGTGRRSGLKIRRPSGLGGSTPPPGTTPSIRDRFCSRSVMAFLDGASGCTGSLLRSMRIGRECIVQWLHRLQFRVFLGEGYCQDTNFAVL